MKILCKSALLFLLVAVIPLTGMATATNIDRIRCEYLKNPLGIDVATPRFTWEISAGITDVPARLWSRTHRLAGRRQ